MLRHEISRTLTKRETSGPVYDSNDSPDDSRDSPDPVPHASRPSVAGNHWNRRPQSSQSYHSGFRPVAEKTFLATKFHEHSRNGRHPDQCMIPMIHRVIPVIRRVPSHTVLTPGASAITGIALHDHWNYITSRARQICVATWPRQVSTEREVRSQGRWIRLRRADGAAGHGSRSRGNKTRPGCRPVFIRIAALEGSAWLCGVQVYASAQPRLPPCSPANPNRHRAEADGELPPPAARP